MHDEPTNEATPEYLRGVARDIMAMDAETYPEPPAWHAGVKRETPRCNSCGCVAFRLYNRRDKQYEFMCLENGTCGALWAFRPGRAPRRVD